MHKRYSFEEFFLFLLLVLKLDILRRRNIHDSLLFLPSQIDDVSQLLLQALIRFDHLTFVAYSRYNLLNLRRFEFH